MKKQRVLPDVPDVELLMEALLLGEREDDTRVERLFSEIITRLPAGPDPVFLQLLVRGSDQHSQPAVQSASLRIVGRYWPHVIADDVHEHQQYHQQRHHHDHQQLMMMERLMAHLQRTDDEAPIVVFGACDALASMCESARGAQALCSLVEAHRLLPALFSATRHPSLFVERAAARTVASLCRYGLLTDDDPHLRRFVDSALLLVGSHGGNGDLGFLAFVKFLLVFNAHEMVGHLQLIDRSLQRFVVDESSIATQTALELLEVAPRAAHHASQLVVKLLRRGMLTRACQTLVHCSDTQFLAPACRSLLSLMSRTIRRGGDGGDVVANADAEPENNGGIFAAIAGQDVQQHGSRYLAPAFQALRAPFIDSMSVDLATTCALRTSYSIRIRSAAVGMLARARAFPSLASLLNSRDPPPPLSLIRCVLRGCTSPFPAVFTEALNELLASGPRFIFPCVPFLASFCSLMPDTVDRALHTLLLTATTATAGSVREAGRAAVTLLEARGTCSDHLMSVCLDGSASGGDAQLRAEFLRVFCGWRPVSPLLRQLVRPVLAQHDADEWQAAFHLVPLIFEHLIVKNDDDDDEDAMKQHQKASGGDDAECCQLLMLARSHPARPVRERTYELVVQYTAALQRRYSQQQQRNDYHLCVQQMCAEAPLLLQQHRVDQFYGNVLVELAAPESFQEVDCV